LTGFRAAPTDTGVQAAFPLENIIIRVGGWRLF